MKQRIYLLFILFLVSFVYLLISTSVYLISLDAGMLGVTINLFNGGDDGNFYWEQANNVARGLPWIKLSIYPLLIGKLIDFTGIYDPYVIRIFNQIGFVLFIIFSIKLVSAQNENIYSKSIVISFDSFKSKLITMILYLFYTSLIMMVNLSIYRDVWIYFFYMLSLSLIIDIFYKKNFFKIPILFFSLWMLYNFREYAAFGVIFSFVFFIGWSKLRKYCNIYSLILMIFFFIGFIYTFFLHIQLPVVNMTLRDALHYRIMAANMNGASQMNISLEQPNFILFIINYLHSFVGNFIGPLPWHVKGFSTFFVMIVESLPMVFILSVIYKKRKQLNIIQKYLLCNAFIWTLMISITNDNMGTSTRLRVISWSLIFICFSVLSVKKIHISARI